MKSSKENSPKIIARNKKASHDYHFEEKIVAGISLQGTEVKSCRAGNIQMRDSFVRLKNMEAHLVNVHISPYSHSSYFNHDPLRERKLLLTKRELRRLTSKVQEKGFTLVPVCFMIVRGLIKVEVALARGKHSYDKRESLKSRAIAMETKRFTREKY